MKHDLDTEWVIQQCEAAGFFISPPGWASVRLLPDRIGVGYETIIAYIKGTYGYFGYKKKDHVRISEWMLAQETKNPGWLLSLVETWEEDDHSYVEACMNFPDLGPLSDEQLVEAFETWCGAYNDQWAISLIMDAWNLHSEELLVAELRPQLDALGRSGDLAKLLPVLTAPVDQSFAGKEEEDLWRILAAVEDKNDLTVEKLLDVAREALEKHARKYHWIQNSYLEARQLGPKHFAELLVEMSSKDPEEEIQRILTAPETAKEKKQKTIQELGLNDNTKRILQMIEIVAIWQDTRKKNNLIGDYYMQLFLDELCRRKEWTVEECRGIGFHQYGDALLDKMDLEKIHAQSNESFTVFTHESMDIFTGEEARKYFEKTQADDEEHTANLRGTCASPGRAEGIVRIVRETSDIPKMQQGDILVSGMTRPELVPAMKLAAALVTDEGGMTSHAAVVSRELGIPCVVGTKNATKVFKDGDMVEVLADHGAVKKVELGDMNA